MSKRLLYSALALILLVGGVFLVRGFFQAPEEEPEEIVVEEPVVEVPFVQKDVIGLSVQGRDIERFQYGTGETHLLLVGGIHGGYEWNSVILAYEVADYIEDNPDIIPENLTVTVIPSLNPDGVYEVLGEEGRFSRIDALERDPKDGTGRFNANGVDLNRNFDCKWQPKSSWRGNEVSAGTEPFSEPESRALRRAVEDNKPIAAVFWHSQASAVYASECEEGVLPETLTLMNTYGDAAEYKKVESFDAYPVTGDVEGWLASIGVPAVTVELTTHEDVEFDKNLKAVLALIDLYSK